MIIELFYCYAKEDKAFCDALDVHLKSLKQRYQCQIYDSGDLSGGGKWSQEIYKHLNRADIILMLISADFIASDDCFNAAVQAVKRQKRGEAVAIIPILIRACNTEVLPFEKSALRPPNGIPIRLAPAAWADVSKDVRHAVEHRLSPPLPPPKQNAVWMVLFSVVLLSVILLVLIIPRIWPLSTQTCLEEYIDNLNVLCHLNTHESIGISDGKFMLASNTYGGGFSISNKKDAAQALRKGELKAAQGYWDDVLRQAPNDAETLIYQENQRVKEEHEKSGIAYVTFVVGAMLHESDGLGPSILQGAYLFQKKHNRPTPDLSQTQVQLPRNTKIRLLIAKSGIEPTNSAYIAKMIVKAKNKEKTIIGILGWSTTTSTKCTMKIFTDAKLPMVTATAVGKTLYTDDTTKCEHLNRASGYFFRIFPPDSRQMEVLVPWLEANKLLGDTVIFSKKDDNYADSISNAFKDEFKIIYGPKQITTHYYTDPHDLKEKLGKLTLQKPKVLFIATPELRDLITCFNNIPPDLTNLTIATGSTGYQLVNFTDTVEHYAQLTFSTAAFPDMWKEGSIHFTTIEEYKKIFSLNGKSPTGNPYGWTRPNAVAMAAYDAMLTLVTAYHPAKDLQEGLKQINPVEGITGRIAFDDDGEPINKLVVLLKQDDGHNMVECDGYLTKDRYLDKNCP